MERIICKFRHLPSPGLHDLTPGFRTVSQSVTVGYFPFVPYFIGSDIDSRRAHLSGPRLRRGASKG